MPLDPELDPEFQEPEMGPELGPEVAPEVAPEPEPERMEDRLRQTQLETYRAGQNKPPGQRPIAKDDSDGPKNYRALARVWMPLALDEVGQTPWAVNEIRDAMMPLIKNWAREFGRHRGSYQEDDAISKGDEALLLALEKDRGRAPFGLYAAKQIRRAIAKGAREASILPHPQRKQTYTDRYVTSLDRELPSGDRATIGGTLRSDVPILQRSRCPACGGSGKGEDKLECQVCLGKGFLVLSGETRAALSPDEEVAEKEAIRITKKQLGKILEAAQLSPRQFEIFLMHHGVEGVADPSLITTGFNKKPTEISRILGYADTIHKVHPEVPGVRTPPASGIWPKAVELDKVDEFQAIWDEVFDDIPHGPFDPDLPTSLQIAPLVWEYDKAIENRIPDLVSRLQSAITNVPTKPLSRQYAKIQLDKAIEKVHRVKGEFASPETRECVQRLLDSKQQTLIEREIGPRELLLLCI